MHLNIDPGAVQPPDLHTEAAGDARGARSKGPWVGPKGPKGEVDRWRYVGCKDLIPSGELT